MDDTTPCGITKRLPRLGPEEAHKSSNPALMLRDLPTRNGDACSVRGAAVSVRGMWLQLDGASSNGARARHGRAEPIRRVLLRGRTSLLRVSSAEQGKTSKRCIVQGTMSMASRHKTAQ